MYGIMCKIMHRKICKRWRLPALILLASASCVAQTPAAPSAQAREIPEAPSSTQRKSASSTHIFWDTKNRWLFTGVAAVRAGDGISTRNFRARGRDEILLNNPTVDNAPAFAAIEAAGLGASIGLSYWMHRTGHHKAERWISILHIGVAGFGTARNFSLKSHHPVASPLAPHN